MKLRIVAVTSAAALLVVLGVLGIAVLKRAADGDPLPPLLRGATAAGGWWGACPPRSHSEAQLQKDLPLALSPELNRRLSLDFPTGTTEEILIKTLSDQQFKFLEPCASDRSVRQAVYRQKNGLTPAFSAIFWKVDTSKSLVWVKGFVSFEGP